jgi:exonuclease VII small subunit
MASRLAVHHVWGAGVALFTMPRIKHTTSVLHARAEWARSGSTRFGILRSRQRLLHSAVPMRQPGLAQLGDKEATHRALVPLIQNKLDGFVLWFFANKEKLEAQARGEACPHHESPDDCPSKNDASHLCPFTRGHHAEAAIGSRWTADECSEAEAQVEKQVTKAERQLHLLEHALGPYARGERNAFHGPLRLSNGQQDVQVTSFDALLAVYHAEIVQRHGADPSGWASDGDVQRLVLELTTKFLQAAEPDFEVKD